MPRKLKPQKVEEVRHPKYGGTAEIMFDRNPDMLDFFATVGNETIRSKDAQQLKRDALKLIEQGSKLAWRPIIFLSTEQNVGVHVESRRFWWAQRTDGRMLESHWQYQNDEDRVKWAQAFYWNFTSQPPFEPPVRPYKYGRIPGPKIYLPYTEETWAAVELLQERLAGIKEQINQLVNSDHGIAVLQNVGAHAIRNLLPMPQS